MKTLKQYLAIALAAISIASVNGQPKNAEGLLEALPKNLELKDDLQVYEMVVHHTNGDIFGNFFNKMCVRGQYTRGLGSGKVRWNQATVATSMQRDGTYPEGEKLDYMENFTYVPSAAMMNPENFTTFSNHSVFAKNLIWDMMGIEGIAWSCFDQLELNQPFSATSFNMKIDLAGQGFFENKNMVITWTGISECNHELCAVVDYRTLNNPLEFKGDGMEMKGLSNYWGSILVSLVDKQIEHATLFENVTMEMLLPGQTNKQLFNTIREISVIKKQATK